MGLSWSEHSEQIEAPIETCFAAITDYESFPGWQDAVDSIEVLDRTDDGIGRRVHLFVDAKVRKINYVLSYAYERPTRITWDFVEGDGMRDMDGSYSFEALGPDRTRATYDLGADPAIPAPGMIIRRTHRQLVKRSVEDLKREAERRHAAGESVAAAEPAVDGDAPQRPPEAGAAEGRAEPAADDWVPKAARDAAARAENVPRAGTGDRERRSATGDSAEDAAAELAAKLAEGGRELAEAAARAGLDAAERALRLGRELVRRIERELDDERRDGERRNDER